MVYKLELNNIAFYHSLLECVGVRMCVFSPASLFKELVLQAGHTVGTDIYQ